MLVEYIVRDEGVNQPPSWSHMMDLFTGLGGDFCEYNTWIQETHNGIRRSRAEAWSQLIAAVRNQVKLLEHDRNPPAGVLLDVVRRRLW